MSRIILLTTLLSTLVSCNYYKNSYCNGGTQYNKLLEPFVGKMLTPVLSDGEKKEDDVGYVIRSTEFKYKAVVQDSNKLLEMYDVYSCKTGDITVFETRNQNNGSYTMYHLLEAKDGSSFLGIVEFDNEEMEKAGIKFKSGVVQNYGISINRLYQYSSYNSYIFP